MKLYHVSVHNRSANSVDMSLNKKHDLKYVFYLLDSATSYQDFCNAFNSNITTACSEEKGWPREKLAAEAIFEYIRYSRYRESPSRLSYAYFTDELEKAKKFNKEWRDNQGAIFEFSADDTNVYCYDMDIFDRAVKYFIQDLTITSYEEVKELAIKYWKTSVQGNTEILYKGYPVITCILHPAVVTNAFYNGCSAQQNGRL